MDTPPKRFQSARHTDWEEGTPVRELIEEYLNNFNEYYNKGLAPFFFGVSGCGKTHAAAAIFNAISHGSNETLSLVWASASEFLNQVLDAKDLHMKDTYIALKSALRSADFLVLDDISALRGYSRITELFWTILDHRYGELKPTLITSNFQGHEVDVFSYISEDFSSPVARRIKHGSKGLSLML